MRRHYGGETVGEIDQVLFQPQVAHQLFALQAEIGPKHRSLVRLLARIEERDGYERGLAHIWIVLCCQYRCPALPMGY